MATEKGINRKINALTTALEKKLKTPKGWKLDAEGWYYRKLPKQDVEAAKMFFKKYGKKGWGLGFVSENHKKVFVSFPKTCPKLDKFIENRRPRIVIYVEGGNVQGAMSNVKGIDVDVFDVDNIKEDDELLTEDGESPDIDAMYKERTRGLTAVY